MTASLEASTRVFDAMVALVDAVDACMDADPDCSLAFEPGTAYGLLREDGVSIVYRPGAPNELHFTVQVPMDSVIAAVDKLQRGGEVKP